MDEESLAMRRDLPSDGNVRLASRGSTADRPGDAATSFQISIASQYRGGSRP